MIPVRTLALVVGTGLVLALGGCTYDYLQHTDRVGFHAGDAVKANLEAETVDPQKPSLYKTTGLGEDGYVIPADQSAGSN